MTITKINMFRCEDGSVFEDLESAQLHHQKMVSDSQLSDFVIMECDSIVKFHDINELIELVRAITKEFVVIRRSHQIDLAALEVEICKTRDIFERGSMNTLVKLIVKTEQQV